ncbi:MAG: hypothetical protein XD88_0208, partial [Methanocalculus sp. 52_23]
MLSCGDVVKHHYYGVGRIIGERYKGYQKQVKFRNGECIWINNGALILLDPDDPAYLDLASFTTDILPGTSDEREQQEETHVPESIVPPDESEKRKDRSSELSTDRAKLGSENAPKKPIKEAYLNA